MPPVRHGSDAAGVADGSGSGAASANGVAANPAAHASTSATANAPLVQIYRGAGGTAASGSMRRCSLSSDQNVDGIFACMEL